MAKKIAVILLNLGGPDKPESVQPFLFNLFNDKAIIGAPQPIRWCIAKLISTRRAPVAQEIYEHLGGKSPLLDLTEAQAEALETQLNTNISNGANRQNEPSAAEGASYASDSMSRSGDNYKIFITMRYWHPMSPETVAKVKDWGADEIVLLPLYPQFSTTTSGSSFEDWDKEAQKQDLDVPTAKIGCYPTQDEFIDSHVEILEAEYEKAKAHGDPRILFSAHGLPQKIVDGGDPYEWHVRNGAERIHHALADKLGIKPEAIDNQVCFQSKVGPLKWLEPSTETAIEEACKDKKPIILVPIAFVSEHSETLVELDIEYKELADEHGCLYYGRTLALGTQSDYIDGLEKLVKMAKTGTTIAHNGGRLCPPEFSKCACRDQSLAA